MDSIGIDEQEAITSVIGSEKVQLIYRPETHSMAEVKAAIEAAAASGDVIELGPGLFEIDIKLIGVNTPENCWGCTGFEKC